MVAQGGPTARLRSPGLIEVLDQGATTIATFLLLNAWPQKYVAAELHAGYANEGALEKITIAHEGFERVANQGSRPQVASDTRPRGESGASPSWP